MEEETLCSSLPDHTDSFLQEPQQDSWMSTEHQRINGEQEAIVLSTTGMLINQAHGVDQLSLTLKAGQESPEEAEQWEQIIWPVRPMSCTSPRLSIATVQWDMPGPFTETPSPMTDRTLANELNYSGVTSLGSTSLSLHQSDDDNAEPLTPEEREEQDVFDSQPLNSGVEWTGNSSEPCDAADAQEPATQEKEDSAHEPADSGNEIPLRGGAEEQEEECSSPPDTVETVDLIDTVNVIEGPEDEADSLKDLKLEEEQEEPDVLLTGQGDSEEQQTSENSAVGSEEENEEGGNEEDKDEDNDNEEWQSEEPLEESPCLGTDEDTEIPERLHEDPTDQTEEPEMCEDVDHNMDHEESEAADNEGEEASIQGEENAEKIEKSQDILDLSEKLEEISCSEQQECEQTSSQEREASPQPEHLEAEQPEVPEQIQAEVSHQIEEQQSQHLEQSPQMELTEEPAQLETAELTEEPAQPETAELTEEPAQPETAELTEEPAQPETAELTEEPAQPETAELTEESTQSEQTAKQLVQPENSDETETTEQLSPGTEATQPTAETEVNQVGTQAETSHQGEEEGAPEDGDIQTVVANGEQLTPPETAVPQENHMNGGEVEREMARRLAKRLYKLDGIQRVDVVKHLDKDNAFSQAVGEEYLKFFDFTGQTLDHALRSFLKVVVLIGESQERERVLQHFACRYHECNPDSFSSSGAVLALTCALMLLNTDLHGQHVGKSMSASKFVSNLDGMNEDENFNKDLLKSLYNSIKNEPLEWAVDEEELKNSVVPDEDAGDCATLRSKANPFQDVPLDKKASVVKEGFLQRKLHADIDGKRTPWGKRGWKTFYGVLRGMVLYLQKDDYKREQQINEEVVSVHHSLAEQAADYTKNRTSSVCRRPIGGFSSSRPRKSQHSWNLSKVEMNSWISRINLVSALHSSPPFPAAVGSQRKFFRPILPAVQSVHTLERQLQSHAGMLESFKADLSYLQENPPEGKKAKAKELEELRVRADYLQHEMCRYETYIQVLEAWQNMQKTGNGVLSTADLNLFDKAMCADTAVEEEEEEGGLKKSHSSPSLELELAPPPVVKVRRNISERRTYRRIVIPRRNKEV
ncbi:hypothetical protein INR49_015336 [Caranx melampygus]|nr:hypothetical protein INR49_015336 [Caranx melampygus]